MEQYYPDYLRLLSDLGGVLDRLADLSRKKTEAVCRDDLTALDAVLKQEQAEALAIRGLEQKRSDLTARLGLQGVTLSAVPERYPKELRTQAAQTVQALQRSYNIYGAAAQVARNTLECNLHQIDLIVESMGGPKPGGAGYEHQVELPSNMKTDFRA